MMDFLRRLAPARATDATRAFALLPARFASENPLQATIAQARPAERPGDGQAAAQPDAASPGATGNTPAPQPEPATGVRPSHAMPRPLAGAPPRIEGKTAALPPLVPARASARSAAGAQPHAPGADVVNPRVAQDRQGNHPAATSPAIPAGQVPAAASPGVHVIAAPPAPGRVAFALPLSQAVLAQRRLASRVDSQEVHVTIGRIDVVAGTAPAPAAPHGPAPRRASVTLADYLRGNTGGHQ
jgi:hypothetical protein